MTTRLCETEVIEIFRQCGVFIRGHFVLRSGLHSLDYFEKGHLIAHPTVLSKLCEATASEFSGDNIQTVISPAVAGVSIGQWIAFHLSAMSGREVNAVFADNVDGRLVLKRGFDQYIAGRRTLIVEDVVTRGTAISELKSLVRQNHGNVVAGCAIADRGGLTADDLGLPKFSVLARVILPAYGPGKKTCLGCMANIPIDSIHGH